VDGTMGQLSEDSRPSTSLKIPQGAPRLTLAHHRSPDSGVADRHPWGSPVSLVAEHMGPLAGP
jgi:hypothetical protein